MSYIKIVLIAVTAILACSANAWAIEEDFERLTESKIKNFRAAEMVWKKLAKAGCEEATIYRDSLTLELNKLQAAKAKKVAMEKE